MAPSSSNDVVLRNVLPVLHLRSSFHTMGLTCWQTSTALCTSSRVAAGGLQAAVSGLAHYLASSLAAQALQTSDVTQATALQLTRGPSQRLRKQSAVMTIEDATTLWPYDGLRLEVCHMNVKIASCSVWSNSSKCGNEGRGKVCYLWLLWLVWTCAWWMYRQSSTIASEVNKARPSTSYVDNT